MYIDEAGVENTLDYAYGWSPKGTRCFAETLGHFTQRVRAGAVASILPKTSMIAAWCVGEVFAPMTFTGYCNSTVVETWFERVLIPTLKAGQVVILDNASFHRKATLQKLLEPLGCHLLALPPYSPDLVLDKAAPVLALKQHLTGLAAPGPVRNCIELLWNQIKALIKHHPNPDRPFRNKVDDAFCSL